MKLTFLLVIVLFPISKSFGQKNSWIWSVSVSNAACHFTGEDARAITILSPQYHNNVDIPANHYHAGYNDGSLLGLRFSGGLDISKQLSKAWELQVDVLFSSEGGAIRTVDQAPAQVVPGDLDYERAIAIDGTGKTFFQLTYLKFPITIKWFPGNSKKYYLSTGVYYGRLLGAHEKGSFTGRYIHYNNYGKVGVPDSLKFAYKTSSPYRQTDFGVCLGVGYRLPAIRHKNNLWLIAAYERGIENISRLQEIYGNDSPPDARFYNESWSLGLSWELNL
jgi:hypothetical protein